jgi:adenylate cyclase
VAMPRVSGDRRHAPVGIACRRARRALEGGDPRSAVFSPDPAYHATGSGLPLAVRAVEVMERKLSAILAADVAGYGRLLGVDEEGTLNALRSHREVVDGLISTHRGRVFSSASDSVVAEFPGAVEAINCAVEIQQEMDERNEPVPQDKRLEFRIGLNIGDAMAEGRKLLGDSVNIAARVQELAEPGGICVTRTVYSQAKHKVAVAFESLGQHHLKDIADPVSIYRVLLDGTTWRPRILRWLHLIRHSKAV